MKHLTKYFFQGFSLAKNNLDLFIILVALSFLSTIQYLPFAASVKNNMFVSFITLFLGLLSFSFYFSLPKFFLMEKKDYRQIFRITFRNIVRILPLLGLALVAGLIIVLYLIFQNTGSPPDQFVNSINDLFKKIRIFGPFHLIFFFLVSLLSFDAIYFAIKNLNIISALIKSIAFSLKNLKFVFIIFVIRSLLFYLTSVLPTDGLFSNSINFLIIPFIVFVISASTLRYFEAVEKNSK